jgi:hypothetical protein
MGLNTSNCTLKNLHHCEIPWALMRISQLFSKALEVFPPLQGSGAVDAQSQIRNVFLPRAERTDRVGDRDFRTHLFALGFQAFVSDDVHILICGPEK